ncbi:MAG: serine/threonine-protein kinase [Cyanobacteria bacterium P01_E01_bin.42]
MTTATASENNYKYSLEDPVGQGIFSTTYPAIEVNSDRPVIIKTLAANLHDHPQFDRFRERFLDFSHRLARISHPHLPGVWESFAEDGIPYIVYDRILGENLADKIASEGAVSESRAKKWIEQIASGLVTLHEAGLQHLDIQPRNIIYRSETDDVVLVDLGMTCDLTPEIRQTHANLISPGYAAIEQYDPKGQTSTATDIYGLSAVFYFLLAGNPLPPVPLLEHIPPEKWQKFPEGIGAETRGAILHGLSAPDKRSQTVEAWLAQWHPAPTVEAAETVREQADARVREELLKEQAPAVELPTLPPPASTNPPAPLEELESTGEISSLPSVKKSKSARPKTEVVAGKTPRKGKKQQKPRKKAVKSSQTQRVEKLRFPVGALLMTSAIAASAGAGFGLSLRLNRPTEAGSTFWHNEQSFPPKNDWEQE